MVVESASMGFPVSIAGVCRMRPSRPLFALFPLFLLGWLVLVAPAVAAPGQRVTARQLVRTVGSALTDTAKAAEESGAKPTAFLNALSGMRLRVERIEDTLGRRDEEFFVLVDQGSSDLGALRVAWARAAVKNDRVTAGLRLASASYRLLRSHYGREGIRHRQGVPLSPAERRQFQRVQRAQRRFAESLPPLRERALQREDRTSVSELDRFRSEAERIAWAALDLEAYLNALIASGEMRGEWEANAPYLRADDPDAFAAADETVQSLYVESDIGHVFAVDLGGWGQLEQEMEIASIEVYQLAQDGETTTAVEEVSDPVDETAAEGTEESPDEAEPSEEVESDSLADPEGLEEVAELAGSEEILEEEELTAEEGTVEDVQAVPAAEGEAKPEADPVAPKAGTPAEATPKKAEPPPSVSPPIG
jgi:hypothetical protein